MRSGISHNALILAACAAVAFVCVRAAEAQTTAGSAASASSWQAGKSGSAPVGPAVHAAVAGSSSSWTAGRGSIPSRNQAGGIWRDENVVEAAPSKATTGAPGATVQASAKPTGLAGLNTSFTSTKTGTAAAHAPKSSIGRHASNGAHGARGSGAGNGTGAGARKVSGARRGPAGARRQTVLKSKSKSSSLGAGLGSPLQNDHGLNSLSPPSSLPGLDTGLKSPLAGSSH
jgi:hypothetical protein